MEAAAATREWSPVDVYWDPRYQRYFYAGAGEDAQYTGEFDQWEGLDECDPAAVPILVTPGGGKRPKGRRIQWMDEVPNADVIPVADVVPVADGTPRYESYLAMLILAMMAVLVLLVIALFIVWLWVYLHERHGFLRHGAASSSANEGLSTAASAPPAAVDAFTKGTSGEGEAGRRAIDFVSNDTDTTENPPKQAARRRRDITEHSGAICLYTDRDNAIGSYEIVGQEWTPPGAQHCDLLIRCCYILESDMTLRPETSRTHPSKSTPLPDDQASGGRDVANGRSTEVLVAVRERQSAFQSLLATGGQRARDDFVRNAASLARSHRYAGLRLWWRDGARAAKVVRGRGLRALDEVLGSTASLLLYPTTSAVGNASEWPSPSRMMGDETPARTSPGRSICHLFLPTTAVSVALANASQACDANRVQRVVAESEFMSLERLSKLCRSWDPSSWKVSRRRYHSYACGFGADGKKGIVFQTPQQALRHRRKLLARTKSTCVGFVGDEHDFPHDCLSSPLFVSGLF
ncbi:hypothetical protein MTO96_024554 [Rhipicephalus appendiculatus]